MTEKRFTKGIECGFITCFYDYGKHMDTDVLLDTLNKLNDENEQLKKIIEDNVDFKTIFTDRDLNDICNEMGYELSENEIKLQRLEKENEQLQQRNDRQAKQLDRLYRLIEEKDWRTLSDILDDFQRCEELLQRESGTYSDLND